MQFQSPEPVAVWERRFDLLIAFAPMIVGALAYIAVVALSLGAKLRRRCHAAAASM